MWQGNPQGADRSSGESRQRVGGDKAGAKDQVSVRYFVIASGEYWSEVEKVLLRAVESGDQMVLPEAIDEDCGGGQDTILHDTASILGADAVLLVDGWLSCPYSLTLLSIARACQKPVIDAATGDPSPMQVYPWRVDEA